MTAVPSLEDEAVTLCHDLMRIDTSNYGDDSGPGERVAAEYIAARLGEVGLPVEIIEPRPGRTTVVARWEAVDRGRPALLVHAHTDVVPAEPALWRFHPLSGEIADGYLWGRGAVDMKYFAAQVLAVIRARMRAGRPPARDVVLAFLADEENAGKYGARWLVDHRPELFTDCTEAIGEVGGYSATLPTGRRLYLIQSAEKGVAWFRLTTAGVAGHASMLNPRNSVVELAEVVERIGRHRFPVRITGSTRMLFEALAAELDETFDPADPAPLLKAIAPLERMVGATLRDIASPTRLAAGNKTNVIPSAATAEIDCRFVPGFEEQFVAELRRLAGPDTECEIILREDAVETPFDVPLTDAMAASLAAEDPGSGLVPYLLPAGTDAKHFSRLGIACFGFAPLRLLGDFDFPAAFHGVDERVPVDAVRFGARVLDKFFDLC
ncbi:M20/M25/M40 family metallo-hydrolase [Nocardia sp. alder85J]|uniref:M20/M25/M40 family metallo-hydrolase n=1 Tax=Nocardia sp. alder85J TaxID=2862949 RepID=UPI001CD73A3D|nr:M20/M25/M40 family metallo-hydrolase [Nocardia sp. alder85J]MCX4094101.1 M20/M25/M40 family metallo-hydrolase [Nocardia sp. alder85J]